MFEDVFQKLKETEIEMKDLKREKAQAELLVALIVKKIGEVSITFEELTKVDYQKVKLLPDEANSEKVTVFYEDNK